MREIIIDQFNPLKSCILKTLDKFDLDVDKFNEDYNTYIKYKSELSPESLPDIKKSLEKEFENIMDVILIVRNIWEECSDYWTTKLNNLKS